MLTLSLLVAAHRCLRAVLTQCLLICAAMFAWPRNTGFKNFVCGDVSAEKFSLPPSIPALHLVSWVLTCLVVNPPTEPLFHRATLSCELAGS